MGIGGEFFLARWGVSGGEWGSVGVSGGRWGSVGMGTRFSKAQLIFVKG